MSNFEDDFNYDDIEEAHQSQLSAKEPVRQQAPQKQTASTSLTDSDPITFGKHKGTPLGEIPSSYLLWLWDNAEFYQSKQATPARQRLHHYIKSGLNDLMRDCPNFPLEHH